MSAGLVIPVAPAEPPASCDAVTLLPAGGPACLETVRVGLCGVGQIGQAVLRVAAAEAKRLAALGIDLQFVAGLVRDPARARAAGALPLSTDPQQFLAAAPDVMVEVLGGPEPARTIVLDALARGMAVVTANKTLVAWHGAEIDRAARRHGRPLAFDAAVVAGVPFVGALARRPFLARAHRIAGILNGTSNFVLTGIARGASFAASLEAAKVRGFAEPDAEADTSGRDAAEKLAILIGLSGCHVHPDALPACRLDAVDRAELDLARALGGTVKPVAMADLAPRHEAWVGPAFVPDGHPFAAVHGSTNTLALTGPGETTVTFTGPGAGPEITAATILDDVVEIVRAGQPRAVTAFEPPARAEFLPDPPRGAWFVAITSPSIAPVDISDYLFSGGLSARRIERVEGSVGLLTWPASSGAVRHVLDPLQAIGLRVVALPVVGDESHV